MHGEQQVQYVIQQPYHRPPQRQTMEVKEKVNNAAYACVACGGLTCALASFALCPGPSTALYVSGNLILTSSGLSSVTYLTAKGIGVACGAATACNSLTICGAKHLCGN